MPFTSMAFWVTAYMAVSSSGVAGSSATRVISSGLSATPSPSLSGPMDFVVME